jgi:DNA-binding MarR family transcriptional regulator
MRSPRRAIALLGVAAALALAAAPAGADEGERSAPPAPALPAAAPVEPPAAPDLAAPPPGATDLAAPAALAAGCLALATLLGWRQVHSGNALGHEGRAAILAHLRARPGDHLRGVARALGLTPQNASHHLRKLEACGLVAGAAEGGMRCYYPAGLGRPARERARAARALARPGRGRILALAAAEPGIHQRALARQLGVGDAAVHAGVRPLLELGLLEEVHEQGRRCFAATPEGEAALRALRPGQGWPPASAEEA